MVIDGVSVCMILQWILLGGKGSLDTEHLAGPSRG